MEQQYFKKLSGFKRGPTGIEWWLFRRLPKIFCYGTLSMMIVGFSLYQTLYYLLGYLFSYWFFCGATMIGCILVLIMKGPAYVADGYDLPKEDPNKERFEV